MQNLYFNGLNHHHNFPWLNHNFQFLLQDSSTNARSLRQGRRMRLQCHVRPRRQNQVAVGMEDLRHVGNIWAFSPGKCPYFAERKLPKRKVAGDSGCLWIFMVDVTELVGFKNQQPSLSSLRAPGALGGSVSSVSCHHHSAPALSGSRDAKPQEVRGR